jgi:hypothetical protein
MRTAASAVGPLGLETSDCRTLRDQKPARLTSRLGKAASRLARPLRVALAVVLALLTVRLLAANPAPLRELLHVDPWVVISIALLAISNQWLMAWRFKLVMKQCAGADIPHATWFRLTSVGQFLNLLFPQIGHLHRALVLKRDFGTSYVAYTSGMLVFFWFDLLTSFLFAVLVVGVQDPGFRVAGLAVLPLLVAASVMLVVLPALLRWVAARTRLDWAGVKWGVERVLTVLVSIRDASKSGSFVLRFLLLNVVVVIGHVAVLALAFEAVKCPLGLGDLMMFQVLLKLSNQVMITPGNVGLTELAYGVLAGAASAGVQHGIAAAVLLRTIGTVVIVGLGWALGGVTVLVGGRAMLTRDGGPTVPRGEQG